MTPRTGIQSDSGDLTATRWSVVQKAGAVETSMRIEALESLCRSYWYPLYCFARRWGSRPHDAQDLTQGFFAVFLERNYLARADPGRGRFRTFLLTSFRNFLTNEWKRTQTARRGGGWRAIPFDAQSAEERYVWDRVEPEPPDRAFDRTWAIATLQQAMKRVNHDYAAAGKSELYEALKLRLWSGNDEVPCAEMAARLHLTKAAFKMAMTRLRHRFREALRHEVGQTVADPVELESELRYLISVLQD